ncbi:MAG: hypothetical protein ACI8ZN_002757 [Bacteroidia bacterium]|jgi:hypothetical protein
MNKNLNKILGLAVVAAMFSLNACKDDTTPTPGPTPGETTTKTCKVASSLDSDGLRYDFTYDGANLVKVVESEDGTTSTSDFVYVAGKLDQINQGSYTYQLVYTNGKVSRIDEKFQGDLEGYYNVTYNANGKLAMVDYFYSDGVGDMLTQRYTYSWSGDNISKVVNIYDFDDNGELDPDEDYVIEINLTAFDNNPSPTYGLPIYLVDFGDVVALSKNNPTSGTLTIDGTPLPISGVNTTNSDGYTSQSKMTAAGSTTTTNFTYTCE